MNDIPTELFGTLPDGVKAVLAERGCALNELASIVVVRPGEALLLAGSYATGEANPTSDLDLLVLTLDDESRAPSGSSNHPSIFGDSYDVRVGTMPVNVEYVPQHRLCALCRVVAPRPGDHRSLANLQALELRLAQRTATGIPLYGAEVAEALRAQVDLDAFQSSATALNFVMAMSLLEDTQVLAGPSALLMLRGAAESLVLAAINAYGPITYDVKHLRSRASRLAGTSGAPAVLADVDRVLFADRLGVEGGAPAVLAHAEDLYGRLRGSGRHATVLAMLEPFVPTWAWSGRGFS